MNLQSKSKEELIKEFHKLQKAYLSLQDKLDKETLKNKAFASSVFEETKDELLDINAQLSLSQSIAKLGYWRFNVKTQKPSWSDECFRMFGIPKEKGEPDYEDHKKYIHPDDWNYFDKSVQELISYDVPYDIQIRLVHENGDVVWVHSKGFSLKNNSGKVHDIFGIIQDITEFKNTEKQLIEQKLLFETMFNTITEGIVITNTNREIIHANNGMLKTFGYHPKDILGKQTKILYADTEKFSEAGNEVFDKDAEKRNKQYLTYYKHKDSSIFPCETFGAKLFNDKNEWIGNIGIMRDVSEREQFISDLQIAKEKAEASKAHLQLVSDNLPIFISHIDKNQRYLFINKTYSDLIELPKEEILGRTIIEVFGQIEYEKISANIKKVLSGELVLFETILNFENKEIYIQSTYIPEIKNKDVIGFFVLAHDISKTKKDEHELIAAKERAEMNEKKYRSLFNAMQEGVYLHKLVYDKQGKAIDYIILEANTISEKYLNIKSEDAIGKTATELFGTNEAPFINVYSKVAETGEPYAFEQYFEPMNKYFFISVFSPKKSEFATAFLDITEKKNYEKELILAKNIAEQNEKEIQKVQKLAHIGSWYLDIESNQVTWTEELYKMYGFDPTLPVPPYTEHMKLFTTESWAILSAAIEQTQKRGTPYELELKTIKKEGNNGWMWVKGEAIRDNNGNITMLWGAAQDISERKILEGELIAAKEKAEEADRLKSAFLANMSHEIRTPMNGILGFTSLLKEPNLSGEAQQRYISIIEKSGARMLNTIHDIIDISKIEAGQVQVSISEINLNEQMDELFEFFLPETKVKNIQLSGMKFIPDHQASIKTDKEKLNSILTNLIKNAIKHTDSGKIEFGYTLKNSGKQPTLEFYVKDTGEGIPKEKQQVIFERFMQANVKDSKVREGFGLGLSISMAYTGMLGGKMWVESEIGLGSQFYFTIPYNGVDIEMLDIPNSDLKKHKLLNKKLKILIAEDDEVAITFLSIVLSDYEKDMLIVNTGTEAVELCQNNPDIDLILMDIRIPGIDGFEATRRIRKFNKDVFILAQTAFALTGDREKCLEVGCNEYITKPIDKDRLLRIIEENF